MNVSLVLVLVRQIMGHTCSHTGFTRGHEIKVSYGRVGRERERERTDMSSSVSSSRLIPPTPSIPTCHDYSHVTYIVPLASVDLRQTEVE